MIVQINSYQEQWQKLMGCTRGGFDNPKSVKYIEGDNIFFSGWFLPLEKDIFIQVDYSNRKSQRFYLDRPRPDVAKVFSLPEGEISCGFLFSLNVENLKYGENIRILVCVKEQEFCVYTIHILEMPGKEYQGVVAGFWKSLLNGNNLDVSNFDVFELTKQILSFNCDDREFLFCRFLESKEYDLFGNFDEFNEFINHFSDNGWSLWAVQEGCKFGGLTHRIKNTAIEYKCVGSYSVFDCNYLHFKIRDLDFFIVQHCRNVAIIFPTLVIAINIWIRPWFDVALHFMKSLIDKIKRNNISGLNDANSVFLGVNISQARPYHFIYDYLHGLDYLSHQNISYSAVITKGYDFLNIGKIFDNVASFQVLSEQEINGQQGFYIAPCWQYIHSDYDKNLIGLSTLLKDRANQLINKPLGVQADFYFWVSVSVEKRRWVEQESGIIEIIKQLSERYPSLCVMIDGRTRVMSEAIGANATAQAETKIFKTIKKPFETNQNVSFVSLIGATMLEKIYWSQYVDTFLTHYMTDSIYVSCIHKKSGVVYSTLLPDSQKALHIHHDILAVQKAIDYSPNEHTYAMKSVSMNWQDVYECIEQVLNKIGR